MALYVLVIHTLLCSETFITDIISPVVAQSLLVTFSYIDKYRMSLDTHPTHIYLHITDPDKALDSIKPHADK